MWTNQTARTTTSGYLQPNGTNNIVSNLNPYAKEFYPSYMKSWRLREESATKIKEPEVKTYTVIEGPRDEKVRIYSTTQELVDVKCNSTMHREIYETRILDTRIHIDPQIKNVKTAKLDLPKNIPSSVSNVERIKKIATSGIAASKSNGLPTSAKCGTLPSRFPNISKLSSGLQPPSGPASKLSTSLASKPKLVTKLVNPKSVLNGYTKDMMPSKSPNKDCLSIKSSISSDKSSSSIICNSSSNKIATTADKPHISRPSLQTNGSSKTLEKSVAGSKLKQISVKSPRKTVASTLRKTETQKVN